MCGVAGTIRGKLTLSLCRLFTSRHPQLTTGSLPHLTSCPGCTEHGQTAGDGPVIDGQLLKTGLCTFRCRICWLQRNPASRLSSQNYHLINYSGRRQFASQLCGAFTYERSSSATDAQPSSRSVRSRSVRRISMARSTPASPAAARP